MSLDVERIAAAVVGLMKSSLQGVMDRVLALEQRSAIPGPPGPQGEPGTIGVCGKDGRDGVDGKDVESSVVADLQAQIDRLTETLAAVQLEQQTVIVGPAGRDGVDGKDVESSLVADLQTQIDSLREALAAVQLEQRTVIVGPAGRDGTNGINGKDGKDGRDGLPGVPGLGGRDGEKGLDGKDGRDGLDGLGFEHLSFEYDETGHLWLVYQRDDVLKKARVPGHVHQGVWKPEGVYVRGDDVTWGGSTWVAVQDHPPSQPETHKSGWLLAVQRGRVGKPGTAGIAGLNGKDGKDGVDRRW